MNTTKPIPIKLKRIGTAGEQRKTRAGIHQSSMVADAKSIADREAIQHTAQYHTTELDRNDREKVIYDQSQIDALLTIATQQYACLSGPAGTGKTTIMSGALPILKNQVPTIDWGAARSAGAFPDQNRRPAIALATFTNVAARNLASKIDPEWSNHCMSIHSLLAFAPIGSPEEGNAYNIQNACSGMFYPRYHKAHKLPYKVIIIDEGGIVPLELWHQLLDACEPDTRIYMLGDLYQLPAIKGVSPMPFAMHKWPTNFLTKIYRQADGSPIITQCHNIRRGLKPDHIPGKFLCGPSETLPTGVHKASNHIRAYIKLLHKRKLFDPDQDIIITPQNTTSLGQEAWNQQFQFDFNPPRLDPVTKTLLNPPILIRVGSDAVDLCVGDKVMATKPAGRATETRFNNGAIGVITAIYPNPNYKGSMEGLGEREEVNAFGMTDNNLDMSELWDATQEAKREADDLFNSDALIEEPDEETASRAGSHIVEVIETATGDKHILTASSEIAALKRSYAVTGHKFQGSQARRVIVIIHSVFHSNMLSREWLYTACTRAREAVILLHDRPSMLKCLQRQELPGKDAKEKAKILTELYKKGRSWSVPRLPEPEPFPATAEDLAQIQTLGE